MDYLKPILRRVALRRRSPALAVFAVVFACAGGGSAMAAGGSDEGDGLPLVIRPPAAGETIGAEARARQERLLRRMQQADYLFRNICRNCGGAIDGPGAYDPFDPVARLGGGPRMEDRAAEPAGGDPPP
jgi:hypothetical protein